MRTGPGAEHDTGEPPHPGRTLPLPPDRSPLPRHGRSDIGDYAMLGDCRGCALVASDGQIDWACPSRFDAPACFASLLGTADHGFWSIKPLGDLVARRRRYRPDSLVLETELSTARGRLQLTDAMIIAAPYPTIVRRVEVIDGELAVDVLVRVRFDYGSIRPLALEDERGIRLLAGQDAVLFASSHPLRTSAGDIAGRVLLKKGAAPLVMQLRAYPSHIESVELTNADDDLCATDAWWREWARRCEYVGEWRAHVVRSLIALKALTFAETGAIVAAATTSIPEWPGSGRNWDYRYVWLRDCALTLSALLNCGYTEEAAAWRNWLERTVAADADAIKPLYGIYGERRIPESELEWLPGFRGSGPVRAGNAASSQRQLDIYGEVFAAFALGRRCGLPATDSAHHTITAEVLRFLAKAWLEPDEGIWEIRGPRRHFTYSKVSAWVAFDRAVAAAEAGELHGPVDEWRSIREAIHRDVCERGVSAARGCFTQSYGSEALDASLLLIPILGFLPASDPRVAATVRAVEDELLDAHGLVLRYATDATGSVDGLRGPEGSFLPCSFWLVANYILQDRAAQARALFEKLLAKSNDLGLYSEEYDSGNGQMLGNFPQAFTHVALINAAVQLARAAGAKSTDRASAEP